MKQEIKDKIINHEFPLLPEDWEKMQQLLNDGKDENPKPIARFLTFKTIIVMSIITFLIIAFWQFAQPEKVQNNPTPTLPKKEGATQRLRALNETKEAFASSEGFLTKMDASEPQNLLHVPKTKAKQRTQKPISTDSIKYKSKKINELAALQETAIDTNKQAVFFLKKDTNTPLSTWRTTLGWSPSPKGRVGVGLEKAYLHLDRSLYKPDEDVWFAMYLRDANTLQPSQQSQILYVDLLAPNGNVQESKTYLVFDGVAAGDFHLPSTLKGGIYKIRAYTNWMKNTNDAFEREITLQAVVLPNLRLQLEFERKAYGAGDEVVGKFDVNSLENKPLRNQKVDFVVSLAGNKLLNGTAETNAEGRAWIKFTLPKDLQSNDGLLNVTLPYNGQTEAISRAVPIVLNKIDLQFLPEGGELLADFDNNLAFKAVNEFGKPADIQGIVKNSKGETVANFKSFHDGMGAFGFQPKQGENYTAHITQPENIAATYDIVAKQNQGAVLLAKTMKDKIEVRIGANDAAFQKAYVVLQMGDKILFEQAIATDLNTMGKLEIVTKDLPMGIARLTLFDQNGTPRNERLVFLNRHKSLNINVKTDKAHYNPREKVSMKINVSDDKGQPVKGNFSLAVADDAQLTFADDKQGHILASLLLESELKGKIEEPNFYFDTKEEKSLEALDYLMLTQGWRRFEWKDAGKEKEIVEGHNFEAENTWLKFQMIDKKTKLPLNNTKVVLLPSKKIYFSDSIGVISIKKLGQKDSFVVINNNNKFNIDQYFKNFKVFVDENNNTFTAWGNNAKNVSNFNDEYYPFTGYGILKGKIMESNIKIPAKNATVSIIKDNTIKQRITSNGLGEFEIILETGTYNIEVKTTGSDTIIMQKIVLNNKETKFINFNVINEKARLITLLSKKDSKPLRNVNITLQQKWIFRTTDSTGKVIITNIDNAFNEYLLIDNQPIYYDLKESCTLYLDENGEIFSESGRQISRISMSNYKGNLCNVYGVVTDLTTRKKVTGAFIILKRGNESTIKFADAKGVYHFDINNGKYDIDIIAQGYLMTSLKNVNFEKGNIVNLNIDLVPQKELILNDTTKYWAAKLKKQKPFEKPKCISNKKNKTSKPCIDMNTIYSISGNCFSNKNIYTSLKNTNSAVLKGNVKELPSSDDVIGAVVKLWKDGIEVKSTSTDYDGNYSINITPEVYDVEISSIGFKTQMIRNVMLNGGKTTKLDIKLDFNHLILEELIVREYKVPLILRDNTTSGSSFIRETINIYFSDERILAGLNTIKKEKRKDIDEDGEEDDDEENYNDYDDEIRMGDYKFNLSRTFYAPIYNPKDKVAVRNDFRTTIFWKPDVTTDDKGEATIEFYNSDALTTFRATLEGIGETGNIGRSEQRYATGMMLNLSAKMPDKVLTGDVIKIPLSLKNNSENAKKISINVTKPSNFEAVGEIPTQVTLAANEAKTLFLSYKVATQSANILGESQTFLIEAQSDDWNDKFVAKVKTLPRGFPVTQIFSANKLQNTFDLALRQPVEKTAKLTLTAYPNPLDDILQGMERMLQQPSGCFEQVSSSNYPNLLVLDLLRNTQQNRPDVEKRALGYLADGYKRLTAYECKSGGFDWWGRDPAHEGLTAYGILEFTDMARVFDVDKTMIDRSVKWLLNRKNNKGGWTLNPNALHGWQNDAVLDAYICYALAEAGYGKEISSEIEQIYNSASAKNDVYTQALLANTFLAVGDENRAKSLINNILQQQMKDGSFEGKTHSVFHSYGKGFTIETTALVALALQKSDEHQAILAKAINYIVQSKSEYGYGNTQSTVMALKALCNYARSQTQQATDGTILVYVNDKIVAKKPYSKSQFGKLQITDLEQFISDEKQQIKVVFEGTTQAIPFDLELKYASKLPQNSLESPLKFSTVLAQSQAKIGDVVRLSANMENKTTQAVASPIMVLGIPAGLTAQPWQLKQIVERKECAFYEIFNNYVVFYFDEIKPKSLININLDLRADIGGSYESPASAAYPYYTNEWRVWSKPEGILVE